MSQAKSAEKVVQDIRRKTRRRFSAEEKVRIVLEGLRGEESIAALCRREGLNPNLYYRWSKEFLEAGKKRLVGDTTREATSNEVTGPPRDGPFRIQALKVAQQQQAEVAARRQTWPADPVGVKPRALGLDEGVKAGVVEHLVQPLVERMPRALRQICAGHPHRLLPRSAAAFAHRHGRECSTRDRSCRSLMSTFTTGC